MLTTITAPASVTGVTAKSVARFGDRKDTRRTSAHREAGAFFAPGLHVCGGRAWEPFGAAGFRVCRFANPRTAAPKLFGDSGDGSDNTHGAIPMRFLTRNPSARAAAHRAMATSALFADTSAATRLKRYNHHAAKARALEEQAGHPLHVVYLARTATRLEIHAPTWQDALRRTGRPDACLVEQTGERSFEVTVGPDTPTTFHCRTRYGTGADALRWALDLALRQMDATGAGGEA